MKKIDPSIKKEISFILLITLILSVLMQAVFLIIRKWDYTVILGNLLSLLLVFANYYFMALSVESAVDKDEKGSKQTLKISQSLRMLMLLAGLAIGFALSCFNIITVAVPLFFPRIALLIRSMVKEKNKNTD